MFIHSGIEQVKYELTFQHFPLKVFNILDLNSIINVKAHSYLFDLETESGILNAFLVLLHNFMSVRPFIFVEHQLYNDGVPDAIISFLPHVCQYLDLGMVMRSMSQIPLSNASIVEVKVADKIVKDEGDVRKQLRNYICTTRGSIPIYLLTAIAKDTGKAAKGIGKLNINELSKRLDQMFKDIIENRFCPRMRDSYNIIKLGYIIIYADYWNILNCNLINCNIKIYFNEYINTEKDIYLNNPCSNLNDIMPNIDLNTKKIVFLTFEKCDKEHITILTSGASRKKSVICFKVE